MDDNTGIERLQSKGLTFRQTEYVKKLRSEGKTWQEIASNFVYDNGEDVSESAVRHRFDIATKDSAPEGEISEPDVEEDSISRILTLDVRMDDGTIQPVDYSLSDYTVDLQLIESPVVGRVVALYDIHFPDHIPQFIPLVVNKFLKDFKPDIVILGGDITDAAAFSPWIEGKINMIRKTQTPKQMFMGLNQYILQPIRRAVGDNCLIVYIKGNHEFRIESAIATDFRGEGYWELENNIDSGLVDVVVPYISETVANIFKVGDLHYIHGHKVRTNLYHAKAMGERYGVSIRYGHFHTSQEYTMERPSHVSKFTIVKCIPCLTHLNPSYMKGVPNSRVLGFNAGYVEKNGMFDDTNCIIHKDGFRFNGVKYS